MELISEDVQYIILVSKIIILPVRLKIADHNLSILVHISNSIILIAEHKLLLWYKPETYEDHINICDFRLRDIVK